MFKITKKSKASKARLGIIKTARGSIETPFFMPDATFGQVKNLSNKDLETLGVECLVTNTLHLFLRPGLNMLKKASGLKGLTNWPGAYLTDSGGYQVYSLIHKSRGALKGKITDQAALFSSPLDGVKINLSPEQSIKIQFIIGAQMIVCLDDCPPNDYENDKLEIAVQRTIGWAKRCKQEYDKNVKNLKRISKDFKKPLLFAVIQGGNNLKLREYCAKELIKIGFDGFGFGARHFDAAGNFLTGALEQTASQIPEDKIRFGLGIGLPEDIIKCVRMGWDMFDCVIPTREGRHGRLFLRQDRGLIKSSGKLNDFYKTINISNSRFKNDFSPLNPLSAHPELRQCAKAYLHYLFKIKEPLSLRLASLNNLEFYITIMREIRELVKNNKL